jgi:hypothetical protein
MLPLGEREHGSRQDWVVRGAPGAWFFKPRLNEVDALRALRRISFSRGLKNRVDVRMDPVPRKLRGQLST